MTERYTGPSARRIADLLPHRVSFDKGWFWTTTAICHGGKSDGLAFRQRPDGEGIETKCHTGGCSKGVVITHLEALVGLPIWTAFEPVVEVADKATEKRPWWKRKKVVVAGIVALVIVAPLITGDGELVFLNLVGLGIGAGCFSGGSCGTVRSEVPTLTTGPLGLSQLIPIARGRLHPGTAPLSLPAGRAHGLQGNTA